jgi:hypothetical protein
MGVGIAPRVVGGEALIVRSVGPRTRSSCCGGSCPSSRGGGTRAICLRSAPIRRMPASGQREVGLLLARAGDRLAKPPWARTRTLRASSGRPAEVRSTRKRRVPLPLTPLAAGSIRSRRSRVGGLARVRAGGRLRGGGAGGHKTRDIPAETGRLQRKGLRSTARHEASGAGAGFFAASSIPEVQKVRAEAGPLASPVPVPEPSVLRGTPGSPSRTPMPPAARASFKRARSRGH